MLHAPTENAVNLCINGGFDERTPAGLVPAAWEITNADSVDASSPTDAAACVPATPLAEQVVPNRWALLHGDEAFPGYRHKLQFIVAGGIVRLTHPCNYLLRNTRVFARDNVPSMLVHGRDLTVEFSVKCLRGSGSLRLLRVDAAGTTLVGAAEAVAPGDWRRINRSFAFENSALNPSPVCSWGLELERAVTSSDAFELQVSAFQMVNGAYSSAPFTGDASYQMLPRGTVVMVLGGICPPGTRPIEQAVPEALGSFISGALAGAGAKIGSEFHSHELGGQVNGVRQRWTKDGGNKSGLRFDTHRHTTSDATHVPPAISMTHCVKL